MKRVLKQSVYVCLLISSFSISFLSTSWSSCNYCKEIGGFGYTCTGIGWSSCGVYWSYRDDACCTDSITDYDCADRSAEGLTTFYYKLTTGTSCYGEYLCSGSSSGCAGDKIIPLSHNCSTVGSSIASSNNTRFSCN